MCRLYTMKASRPGIGEFHSKGEEGARHIGIKLEKILYLKNTFFVKSQHSEKFVWPLFLSFRPFN